MESKTSLLLNNTIISCSLTIEPMMLCPNAKYMLDKQLTHIVEEACTCHWVLSNQSVSLIITSELRSKFLPSVCKVQTNWMLDVCRRQCDKPRRGFQE